MGIEEEIARKRRSMQTAANEWYERQALHERMSEAYRAADMSQSTPVLRTPPEGIQRVINETMQYMRFNAPKIRRGFPDGATRVRPTKQNEWADDYSFDVVVGRDDDYHLTPYTMWFFRDGLVALTSGEGYDVPNTGLYSASTVREKIIETLARY